MIQQNQLKIRKENEDMEKRSATKLENQTAKLENQGAKLESMNAKLENLTVQGAKENQELKQELGELKLQCITKSEIENMISELKSEIHA
jgi:uncharacterized protein YigA (DUF484 family)